MNFFFLVLIAVVCGVVAGLGAVLLGGNLIFWGIFASALMSIFASQTPLSNTNKMG